MSRGAADEEPRCAVAGSPAGWGVDGDFQQALAALLGKEYKSRSSHTPTWKRAVTAGAAPEDRN